MKILITTSSRLPAEKYGGAERVIWCLGKELSRLGHQVLFLADPNSSCPFGEIIPWDASEDPRNLIPSDIDLVHFFSDIPGDVQFPYVITQQGNCPIGSTSDKQTVFVSANHAQRNGSETYVHNGLDWSEVKVTDSSRRGFHFLGKAAWRRKNIRGAISSTMRIEKAQLQVLGGFRLNFSMGFRFTPNPRVRFHGMVDDSYKNEVMQRSLGLVFPVRWNEPFGLALTESLYCGCPVFGTPYGSLPEIVTSEVGFLSAKSSEITDALREAGSWSASTCREYAAENFNSRKMTLSYLELYDKALRGESLNERSPRATDDPGESLPWS